MPQKRLTKKKSASKRKMKLPRIISLALTLWPLTILIVLFLASFLWYYIDQAIKVEQDKTRFAKIEALVDDIKVDLEKAYPDKQWQSVKYCRSSRGPLNNIVSIGCDYGFKVSRMTLDEVGDIVKKRLKSSGREEVGSPSEGYVSGIEKGNCLATSVYDENTRISTVELTCGGSTTFFVYPDITS